MSDKIAEGAPAERREAAGGYIYGQLCDLFFAWTNVLEPRHKYFEGL